MVLGAIETVWRDLLYALRTMRQSPDFTTTAVVTLALAIGGNTAMFTVIRAVLLNPLPYHDPDQLVRLTGGATPTRFAEMKAAAKSLSDIGAYTGSESITLSGANDPEVLKATHVSANFLRLLGVNPVAGRGFLPSEDSGAGAPVALISSELWHRRYSGDARIAAQTITLASSNHTIVGVLPPAFQFPSPGIDVWLTAPSEWSSFPAKSRPLSPFLSLFGRLKDGASLDQANAELKVIRRQYAAAHPAMLDSKAKSPMEVTRMKEELVANVRSMLWMLFGAVGFVLLIACANVANLLLARSAARTREFAVRSAIGAARRRIVGQLLAESVLLAVFGGSLGIALAAFSLRAIPALATLNLPRLSEIHMEWPVLAFAVALSLFTGLLFGLAPAIRASRPDLVNALRASGATAGTRHSVRSLRNLLLVSQVALSVVLLIGAALLLESVAYLRNVEVGFNPSNLLTASVSLPPLQYNTDQKTAAFFQELAKRLDRLPGVQSATAALSLPMTEYAGTPVQDAAKPPLRLNERLIAKIFPVEPEYFRTLAIPLRRGRVFNENDTQDSQRVAVIDESMARYFWPGFPSGIDPVGQRLLVGGVNAKAAEIIGVVADAHQMLDNRKDWKESVYVAFAQNPSSSAMIAVRTAGDPLAFAKAMREQVRSIDSNQTIADVQTMDDRVEAQVGQRRLLMRLLGAFALIALALALVGIYGVISYSVSQRVQELGIRRALGAQQSDIVGLIVGRSILLTITGIAAGILGAVYLTRFMTSLLFGVSAVDPATFGAIAVLFVLVSLLASYFPARRAATVDPVTALRV